MNFNICHCDHSQECGKTVVNLPLGNLTERTYQYRVYNFFLHNQFVMRYICAINGNSSDGAIVCAYGENALQKLTRMALTIRVNFCG